ncbi:hypothetical protein JTB14_001222 [Gonioctena quinquepunctata]|nr:hypothetical protein JTB14_001222 [Gonioctena quinquepunctata]
MHSQPKVESKPKNRENSPERRDASYRPVSEQPRREPPGRRGIFHERPKRDNNVNSRMRRKMQFLSTKSPGETPSLFHKTREVL